MGSTITEQNGTITAKRFVNNTKKWCKEDVLKLAHHFHEWDKETGQHLRVNYLMLNKDRVEQFNKIKKIKEVKICLALDKSDKENVTFRPFLKINDDDQMIFELDPVVIRGFTTPPPSIIPNAFKEMICKNWDKLEMHLIDDLFHCKNENQFQTPIIRVQHFQIGSAYDSDIDKELIEHINTHLGEITNVNLYPGVDMNKVQYNDMISFTPVIGIGTQEDSTKSKGIYGLAGVVGSFPGQYETFYEYLTPCPPTCPPPPPPDPDA